MKYRGIEYRVVQGTGRNNWSWSAVLGNRFLTGRSRQNGAAIIAAERAIDDILGRHSMPAPVAPSAPAAARKEDPAEGDRCRLTPLGRRRCPAIGDRLGTVVNSDGLLTVIFDGLDKASMFHESYIERAPASPQTGRSDSPSEQQSAIR